MRISRVRLLTSGFLFTIAAAVLALSWSSGSSSTILRKYAGRQSAIQVSGPAAKVFLETGEGQSLFAAFTAARLELKQQDHSPSDENNGPGYLGINHEQHLNAWFNSAGLTVTRPLRGEQSFQLTFHLKAYGYGVDLLPAPPIVSQKVNGSRIEYEHSWDEGPTGEGRKLIEWYENQSDGIEQGFILSERPPQQKGGLKRELLRLSVSVGGDLSARRVDAGEQVELLDQAGKPALSYSKLVAVDADGARLATRMEASADGREIALLVDDATARYPILIDPVTASLEQKLDAASYRQTDARFGFAVAIDGDLAAVGAWREDVSDSGQTYPDEGVVYAFQRSGSTWKIITRVSGGEFLVANSQCGYSVAVSDKTVVWGCPGANGGAGRAFFENVGTGKYGELVAPTTTGNRYGTSVAISGNKLIVGSPMDGGIGYAYPFTFNPDGSPAGLGALGGSTEAKGQFGASVAVNGNTFVVGAPGAGVGHAYAYLYDTATGFNNHPVVLQPSDGAAGDNFGNSVSLSGNTAVIGAFGNDEKASDAGAAYVFVRDASGNWTQQQKLMASDAKASDYFSDNAVAMQGNTIIIGAYGFEPFNLAGATDYGKAYVFMRSGTVWTEQTTISGDDNGGDNFGISVGISGTGVIAGARTASGGDGTSRTGAAYVYRLSCVPPYASNASTSGNFGLPQSDYCPGNGVNFESGYYGGTGSAVSYQWRNNGSNIEGATSNKYRINSASASDTGSYDVVVSNSCGSDISSAFAITVHTFSLNPMSQNFGVNGSNGVVNVSSTGNCSWSATANAPWITITSGATGTVPGTVNFSVAANPDSGQRTGSISIGDQSFSISQDGTQCAYSIMPTSQSFDADAATKTIAVTTNAGCKWTATSNDSFISVNSGSSGTGNGTVTYTVAGNFDDAQRTGTLTVAGQNFTVTQGGVATPTPSPTGTASPTSTATATPTPTPERATLDNISTRLAVQTGDNVLIGGFIVSRAEQKQVLVRGLGPSLPVAGALADPVLELHDGSGATILIDDNWQDTQGDQITVTGIPPSNDLEAAIIATLPANNSAYTAVLRGNSSGTGIGLVEVYDLAQSADSELANISTRGFVDRGDNVMIGGFIVGNANLAVLIRAIGPSLPVANALADPYLELHDGNGALLEANDNWVDSSNKQAIIDTTIPPANNLEAAIVRTLSPGNYTAIVSGSGGITGVALVEVYALN